MTNQFQPTALTESLNLFCPCGPNELSATPKLAQTGLADMWRRQASSPTTGLVDNVIFKSTGSALHGQVKSGVPQRLSFGTGLKALSWRRGDVSGVWLYERWNGVRAMLRKLRGVRLNIGNERHSVLRRDQNGARLMLD